MTFKGNTKLGLTWSLLLLVKYCCLKAEELAPPALAKAVLFLKKSHGIPLPVENERLIGQKDHRWPVPSLLGSKMFYPIKNRRTCGALENLLPIFPVPCGVSIFSFSKQVLSHNCVVFHS